MIRRKPPIWNEAHSHKNDWRWMILGPEKHSRKKSFRFPFWPSFWDKKTRKLMYTLQVVMVSKFGISFSMSPFLGAIYWIYSQRRKTQIRYTKKSPKKILEVWIEWNSKRTFFLPFCPYRHQPSYSQLMSKGCPITSKTYKYLGSMVHHSQV